MLIDRAVLHDFRSKPAFREGQAMSNRLHLSSNLSAKFGVRDAAEQSLHLWTLFGADVLVVSILSSRSSHDAGAWGSAGIGGMNTVSFRFGFAILFAWAGEIRCCSLLFRL